MNKRKLNEVFAIVKEKASMDFAITNTDDYGDCQSCVWSAVEDMFGFKSTGIYAKHWLRGTNKGKAYKYLDGLYIGHDITEEQAEILVEIFKENRYKITPEVYIPSQAFYIEEVV